MQLVALPQRHQLTSLVFLEGIREVKVQMPVNLLDELGCGSVGGSERNVCGGVTGSGAVGGSL